MKQKEFAHIKVHVDNTHCDKDLKSIEARLGMTMVIKSDCKNKEVIKRYVCTRKYEGFEKHKAEGRDVELSISEMYWGKKKIKKENTRKDKPY